MPTYEYACTSCGHEWEAEQSIKDNALTDCPSCKAKSAKRQISKSAGFILKGGGWYSDLYSSSGNKKSEGSTTSTPETTTKAADTSTAKKSSDGSGSSGSTGDSGGSSSGGGASSGGSTGSSTPSTAASAA